MMMSNDFQKHLMETLRKDQETDIRQIDRYFELIREIELRINNRTLTMNHLELAYKQVSDEIQNN